MIIERFYDEKLAQASYLIGCAATGEALIVDPNRDVEQYIDYAERRGLHISKITETHIHADFVSGARELRARTTGTLYLSKEGGPDWQYAYAEDEDAVLVGDGDEFMVGNVKIKVLHTPGHTPEHISFEVTDTAATTEPIGLFTGDFVFVGDVGRPDLLERAAKIEGTMEAGARDLHRSLRSLDAYPDHLQIWPGHGAGSACGKALGAIPSSTLGYERMVNWGFRIETEDVFVTEVLAGQPEPPKYFAEMKRINKVGPRVLGGQRELVRLPETRIPAALEAGAVIVDTRRWEDYSNGHIPGTINIPLDQSFTTWAGWLLPYDRPFHLIVDTTHGKDAVLEAVRDLASIGLDAVDGYFDVQAVDDWPPEDLQRVDEMSAKELREYEGEVTVIDVRGQVEWDAGHLPGAKHIPLGYLMERFGEVPGDTPVILQCLTGARSAIAASLLTAEGYTNVINLWGGYAQWVAIGGEVVRDDAVVTAES